MMVPDSVFCKTDERLDSLSNLNTLDRFAYGKLFFCSLSYKKLCVRCFFMTKSVDTRNNWMTFQFLPKCRYKCFRRQTVIDSCIAGFKELEPFGFEFGAMAFPIDQDRKSTRLNSSH